MCPGKYSQRNNWKVGWLLWLSLMTLGCALLIVGVFISLQLYLGPEMRTYLPTDHLPSIPEIIQAYNLSTTPNPDLIPTLQPTIDNYVSNQNPTPIPARPQWVWEKLPLYNWNVELPEGWAYVVTDERPEPTALGATGAAPLGHDCGNYQLISPDRMEFINITMPCGFGETFDGPCGPDTEFIQAVGNDGYLVRTPSVKHIGYLYGISKQGTYNDLSGSHTSFYCPEDEDAFVAAPVYLYWRVSTSLNYIPGPNIDRIMLSLLTSNKNP
jgi:hypothetical protein